MQISETLTLEKLKAMSPGNIIACGISENSPDGIYFTNNDLERKLLWVARRGQIHDWAIYASWLENGIGYTSLQFVLDHGDKVPIKYLDRLISADKDAKEMYRT